MELTLLQATVTLAVLVLVGGEKQTQKPYIAFPRMGRSQGYLAFPRMGRSQLKPETFFDNGACCGVGVKAEYFVSQDGKEVIRSSCAPHLVCCEGLREINDEKTDGVYFSLCIPDTPLAEESGVRSSEILSSLKRLLEK
ncbi:small cardioactive peptides-like isoform X2 [Biomphalaria glabrata]|uniref:Small cardioactive peptides-like isoform X2 n=1 Tax=Biomphalaria glabrata TaxID=6526 RepID=A0A9W2YLS5_BIOGL|nr:small cardioactive peptides-like isoform X2 [Biomphalaria glabrata]